MAPKRGRAHVGASAGGASGSSGSDAAVDLAGRPDLEANALSALKERQRQLKSEAKRVQADLKNKRRQKKRALKRCAALETRDIVQVLLDRGVMLPRANGGSASSGGRSAPVENEAAAAGVLAGAREEEVPEAEEAMVPHEAGASEEAADAEH
jgi:hypothetical protein